MRFAHALSNHRATIDAWSLGVARALTIQRGINDARHRVDVEIAVEERGDAFGGLTRLLQDRAMLEPQRAEAAVRSEPLLQLRELALVDFRQECCVGALFAFALEHGALTGEDFSVIGRRNAMTRYWKRPSTGSSRTSRWMILTAWPCACGSQL